jgi:hypothetical protein
VAFSFRRLVENRVERLLGDIFPADISKGFHRFVTGHHSDGASLCASVSPCRSAHALAGPAQVLRFHSADLRRHPQQAFDQIARPIGISYPERQMQVPFQASTFENRKANAGRFVIVARQGFSIDESRLRPPDGTGTSRPAVRRSTRQG